MKKLFCLLVILITTQSFFAQLEKKPQKITQKGFAKVDFLSINMPETGIMNEPNMGFTGIHYNLLLNNFYTGLGIYGAVSGARGGFFTLGVNAGYKKFLSKKLFLDSGFHFGGGGGANAPDGGGAFILPHFNIGYEFRDFSLNAGWSYVNFFDNGLIKNHQLNFAVEIPLDYDYSNYNNREKMYNIQHLKNSEWDTKAGKFSVMMHLNNLVTKGRSRNTLDPKYNLATIRLAGFEIASYFYKNWFAFIKVDGAFSGIPGGYMDVFFGSGYLLSFNRNRTNLLAKFGVGAGGGGGVDTKGGFLIYPDISIEQQIFKDAFISLNKGFVMSPNSDFYSESYGVGLKYYLEKDGIQSTKSNRESAKLKGLNIIVKQDLYFNAKRKENPTEDMHQISLQVNFDLTKNLYVAGQTSFANFGNAGAYAEGIVGFGLKSNLLLNNSTSFFVQTLAGAAGGGNISTGQGLIIKPSAGLDYTLSNTLKLRASCGYVKARAGELSSPFINLGINYTISFLKLK